MQLIRRIDNPMPISDGLIGAVAGGVVAWLASSLSKVSKGEHDKLAQRVEAIEKNLSNHMTRTEFDGAFNEVKALVREFRQEARAEFKELKSELKSKS